jgi:adenylyltransferase/sulfurtransferase
MTNNHNRNTTKLDHRTMSNTTIRIPTVLRKFAGGSATAEVSGATVIDAISELTARYPALKTHLFTGDGGLRSFVNIYVDDEDVRHQDGERTSLKGGEVVSIVPAVAGGTL